MILNVNIESSIVFCPVLEAVCGHKGNGSNLEVGYVWDMNDNNLIFITVLVIKVGYTKVSHSVADGGRSYRSTGSL